MQTKDHEKIQDWIRERHGRPALIRVNDMEDFGILRVRFNADDDGLEDLTWDAFFEIFDQRDLTFLCTTEKDSTFNKFIYDDE